MYSNLEEREDFKNWKRRKILSLRLGAVITMVPLVIEIMQAIMMRRFIFSTIIIIHANSNYIKSLLNGNVRVYII